MVVEEKYRAQCKGKSLLAQLCRIAAGEEKHVPEQAEHFLDAYIVGFKKDKLQKEDTDAKTQH